MLRHRRKPQRKLQSSILMAGSSVRTASTTVPAMGPAFSFITDQLTDCKENTGHDQYADNDGSCMFCDKRHLFAPPFLSLSFSFYKQWLTCTMKSLNLKSF